MRYQMEESEMERRVMAHMAHRLKADKVVLDRRKYNTQLELELMERQKGMLKDEATKMKEQ